MAVTNENDDHDISDSDYAKSTKSEVKQHNTGAKDLEKVTDYVEEEEIKSSNISDAMKVIGEEKKLADEAVLKVKINKEDVELIAKEMDIPRQLAERKLRSHAEEIERRDEASRIIQRSWRRHVDRQVFQYYKDILNFKASGDPKQLLKSINPREVHLLDRAAGCVVRYRLGGESFPPRLYYKIFTHRNVEDLCANSPKDYTHASAKLKPAILANNRLGEIEIDKSSWYKRSENNGWRPVTDRIFYGLASDPLTERTSKTENNFETNRLVRREDRERRRKERRIKWLQKIYSIGRLEVLNADGTTQEFGMQQEFQDPDAEVEELLNWSSNLNYDEYIKSWAVNATSESS